MLLDVGSVNPACHCRQPLASARNKTTPRTARRSSVKVMLIIGVVLPDRGNPINQLCHLCLSLRLRECSANLQDDGWYASASIQHQTWYKSCDSCECFSFLQIYTSNMPACQKRETELGSSNQKTPVGTTDFRSKHGVHLTVHLTVPSR